MTDHARSSSRTVRHAAPDRLFHWVMAISVIVLGVTAFFPILGVRFDWVPVHWISGVVLTAAVLFHLLRVLVVQGLSEMMPARSDVTMLQREVLFQRVPDLASGKYDIFQKAFHWAVAVVILLLVASGLVMLAKIDTPLWARDPSILSDWNWGIVYVIHGASSLVLLFLFILHIYFSLLPDHRDLLWSMVSGTGPDRAHRPQTDGET